MDGAEDSYSWWVGLPSALYVGATIDVGFWPIYIAVRVCEPVSECCTFLLLGGGGAESTPIYVPQERHMH